MATFEKVVTNPKYQTHVIRVRHEGITLKVGYDTGNWHPEGQPWRAVILADRDRYLDADGWAAGLSSTGATRDEAIYNAYDFAESHTLHFPDGWLLDVMNTIEKHDVQIAK